MPSVCIVHEELAGSARAIAGVSGHPDYPFITVGYPWVPTAGWSDDECRELARALAPGVMAHLVGLDEEAGAAR